MVNLLTGPKGSGKTQKMIELANEQAKKCDGNVVFIKKTHRDTASAVSYTHLWTNKLTSTTGMAHFRKKHGLILHIHKSVELTEIYTFSASVTSVFTKLRQASVNDFIFHILRFQK